jgi:DNA-binding transcriptional LysR family regulator
MFGIERLAEATDAALSGVVRIAAPPAFASHYLAHRLASLREREPGLIIELAGDPRAVSLSRREADIALRLNRPEPGAVLARQVGNLAFGLYGARDYLERRAPGRHDYIGYDESLDHVAQQRWVTGLADGRPLVFRSNELDCLHQATVAGFGLAALPRFMGDADARLARVETDTEAPRRGLWLLVHPDLKRSPRVRLVLDFIAESVRADRAVLDPA